MQKLSEFRPTVFDTAGLGSKGREDWLVLQLDEQRLLEFLQEQTNGEAS